MTGLRISPLVKVAVDTAIRGIGSMRVALSNINVNNGKQVYDIPPVNFYLVGYILIKMALVP